MLLLPSVAMLRLDLRSLHAAYDAGLAPEELIVELYRRFDDEPLEGAWSYRLSRAEALAQVRAFTVDGTRPRPPLFGVPFSAADDIDVAGMPTSAGCRAYTYLPRRSAPVVAELVRAGAICLGKANVDQFATGLSGMSSSFGASRNLFDSRYLAGGSSSGAALTVAAHQVSFSLAVDTTGAGRVPAALSNVVAAKPTRGILPNDGLAWRGRSFACISPITSNVSDAAVLREICARAKRPQSLIPRGFRFATPSKLEFSGDSESRGLYERCIAHLQLLGGVRSVVDFAPFEALGDLLEQLSVMERYAALGGFIELSGRAVSPLVHHTIMRARRYTAAHTFETFVAGEQLARECLEALSGVEFLLTPTVPTHFRVEHGASEPVAIDDKLGTYTRFANLLGSPALCVPAGFRADGLPFGISLTGHPGQDQRLDPYGRALHEFSGAGAGKLRLVS